MISSTLTQSCRAAALGLLTAFVGSGSFAKDPSMLATISGSSASARSSSAHPSSNSGPRSSFSADENLRDPFFPKSKRRAKVQQATATQTEAPVNIPMLLQKEFQGIVTSGDESIALIANVIVEPGRETAIPIRSGGQEKRVVVRCREVTRTAVVLEVTGYPGPITINRDAKP